MSEVRGKNILLIANVGYRQLIRNNLIDLGANVYSINDKPNDGIICKTLGRLQLKAYFKLIDRYYKKIIKSMGISKLDYILVIRGEYTSISIINYLRNKYFNVKIILYMWDSIKNYPIMKKRISYYDKVFSFDRQDCLNNSEIKFLPLFYDKKTIDNLDRTYMYKYDLCFIGTAHGDRPKIIKEIENICKKKGYTYYFYLYLPNKLIYLKNKLLNRDYKNIKISDIHFEKLPLIDSYRIFDSSKCVIDVESISQTGLTMRTIELIGLSKNIITTNKDIINYDFYDKNKIEIFDRKDPALNDEFIMNSSQSMSYNFRDNYSLTNWILKIFDRK